jgi:peptidoglycan L-alanyl-D-glutamate endopeptidase CwlK
MTTLRIGSRGKLVVILQLKLNQLGFSVGVADGHFGPATSKAVKAFQRAKDLHPDGVVGRRSHAELGLDLNPVELITEENSSQEQASTPLCPVSTVIRICHDSSSNNIDEHWPLIYRSLKKLDLDYKEMFLMAIATVYVETGRFAPLDEYISRYNTSPNGHPFDKYDDRSNLGNTGKPDGARYKGRGYIQLTGRENYRVIGKQIGLQEKLEQDPELANSPEVAADILARFLKNKEQRIKDALASGDLRDARKAVNGGSHGLTDFMRIYKLGEQILT